MNPSVGSRTLTLKVWKASVVVWLLKMMILFERFLQLTVVFWTVSTRAPGIISVLIKKEKGKKYCSWPEAVRFMEWKSISVGRLCMPLRFTSTGWIPVMAAGTGAKIRPKHLIFYLSVNALKYSSLPIVRCSCLITLPRFTDRSRPWRLSDNKS